MDKHGEDKAINGIPKIAVAMPDWLSRLYDERAEVKEKRDKLGAFILSPEFENIRSQQKILLRLQYQAMQTYYGCLCERIKETTDS